MCLFAAMQEQHQMPIAIPPQSIVSRSHGVQTSRSPQRHSAMQTAELEKMNVAVQCQKTRCSSTHIQTDNMDLWMMPEKSKTVPAVEKLPEKMKNVDQNFSIATQTDENTKNDSFDHLEEYRKEKRIEKRNDDRPETSLKVRARSDDTVLNDRRLELFSPEDRKFLSFMSLKMVNEVLEEMRKTEEKRQKSHRNTSRISKSRPVELSKLPEKLDRRSSSIQPILLPSSGPDSKNLIARLQFAQRRLLPEVKWTKSALQRFVYQPIYSNARISRQINQEQNFYRKNMEIVKEQLQGTRKSANKPTKERRVRSTESQVDTIGTRVETVQTESPRSVTNKNIQTDPDNVSRIRSSARRRRSSSALSATITHFRQLRDAHPHENRHEKRGEKPGTFKKATTKIETVPVSSSSLTRRRSSDSSSSAPANECSTGDFHTSNNEDATSTKTSSSSSPISEPSEHLENNNRAASSSSAKSVSSETIENAESHASEVDDTVADETTAMSSQMDLRRLSASSAISSLGYSRSILRRASSGEIVMSPTSMYLASRRALFAQPTIPERDSLRTDSVSSYVPSSDFGSVL